MGNIGSQTGHVISQRPVSEEQQWAHSFPRTQPRLYQHKVLPERDVQQKLRHTDNGEILQSGGTLSGRHHQNRLSMRKDENGFDEYSSNEKSSPVIRTYLSDQRDPLHKSGIRHTQSDYKHFRNGFNHNSLKEQMKKFGSEPDLRMPSPHDSQEKQKLRGKKKYKAPLPPNLQTEKSLDWEENSSTENGPTRKARLFKTRAETRKNYSSPVYKHKSLDEEKNSENFTSNNSRCDEINGNNIQIRERTRNIDLKSNRLSLPEIKLIQKPQGNTNFQEELKEATKRLRNIKNEIDNSFTVELNNKNRKQKLKTLDHNINSKDNIRERLKQISEAEERKKNNINCIRGDGSGKESSSPDHSSPRIIRESGRKEQPKTFYFGMDESLQNDNYHNDIIDNFTSNLHTITHVPKVINSSESDLSSEIELDVSQTPRNGIDLQLRPILPKKQLEIPRFSPAAAWKLLSTVDSNPAGSTIASDDVPVFIEDRIEKYSRPPPPTMQAGSRSNNDKSGDSGISGDAGPTGYDENPDVINNSRSSLQMPSCKRPQGLISWTPQQDLGDDSSMEEGLNNENSSYKLGNSTNYSNKHVFSLSLPRENHTSNYTSDKNTPPYSGLQKIKRSVSGVLNNLGNKKELQHPNLVQDQSDNWFLSKSAPTSLNNGFNSLEMKHSKNSDNSDQLLVPNSNSKSSGRVMYLPEFENSQDHRHTRSKSKDDLRERSRNIERSRLDYKSNIYSKSCENIAGDLGSLEPENLQDPPKYNEQSHQWKSDKKPKRFAFQSTIRQIERKRLAEKLSREAEKKEKQRLRELEAMQRVEEEFQKKRAREKATIRQQLRLFSMDDTPWSSLPPNLEVKNDIRPDPDGAVSSSTTSSPSLPLHKPQEQPSKKVYQKNKRPQNNSHKHRPSSDSSEDTKIKAQVTQVLSEYRHPQREYKDYTGSTRYLNDHSDNHVRQTTVHPQVTCNMPKAKGQNSNKTSGTNYRKDFAHGVKSTRSAGSSYSEDSQSRNNSPRMYHNKYSPITRF